MGYKVIALLLLTSTILLGLACTKSAPVAVFHGLGDSVLIYKHLYIKIHKSLFSASSRG